MWHAKLGSQDAHKIEKPGGAILRIAYTWIFQATASCLVLKLISKCLGNTSPTLRLYYIINAVEFLNPKGRRLFGDIRVKVHANSFHFSPRGSFASRCHTETYGGFYHLRLEKKVGYEFEHQGIRNHFLLRAANENCDQFWLLSLISL